MGVSARMNMNQMTRDETFHVHTYAHHYGPAPTCTHTHGTPCFLWLLAQFCYAPVQSYIQERKKRTQTIARPVSLTCVHATQPSQEKMTLMILFIYGETSSAIRTSWMNDYSHPHHTIPYGYRSHR
jgi:hypothetical protein